MKISLGTLIAANLFMGVFFAVNFRFADASYIFRCSDFDHSNQHLRSIAVGFPCTAVVSIDVRDYSTQVIMSEPCDEYGFYMRPVGFWLIRYWFLPNVIFSIVVILIPAWLNVWMFKRTMAFYYMGL